MYTSDDLAAIQRAIAKGLRAAELNGERVEFRSLKEMERIESKIKEALGQATGRRIFNPTTSDGWR